MLFHLGHLLKFTIIYFFSFDRLPVLHSTALHCTAHHYTALQYSTLHHISIQCTSLQYSRLHHISILKTALYFNTLHCTAALPCNLWQGLKWPSNWIAGIPFSSFSMSRHGIPKHFYTRQKCVT